MTSMELKEKDKDKLEQPPSYEESTLLNESVKKVQYLHMIKHELLY